MQNPVLFCFIFIFILYVIPTFLQVTFDENLQITKFYFGLPGILSGDEPHYFVTTTSLINDHDFYIENNYDNAYFYGACDVGFHFVNNTNPQVGRHMMLYDEENKVVTTINEKNEYNASTYSQASFQQIPARPLGLPLFSAFLLWPLKDTCFIEAGAIYVSIFVSLIGVFFFYLICRYYAKKYIQEQERREQLSLLFTLLFALCTQFWHYSKTYFTEPYFTTFLLVAYYFFFIEERKIRSSFIPGFILGIGFTMKDPFGMYLLLFVVLLVWAKQWKRLFLFVAGSTAPVLWILFYNWILTGSIFTFGRATSYLGLLGDTFFGIFASFFHPTFGIIPFAPFLIFAFLGFHALYKLNKKCFYEILLLVVPYTLLWASLSLTDVGAGGAYSGRYLIVILPFLVLLCFFWYIQNKNLFLMKIFFVFAILSFIINAQAAFFYPLFWNNPPWIIFSKLITKGDRLIEIIRESLW